MSEVAGKLENVVLDVAPQIRTALAATAMCLRTGSYQHADTAWYRLCLIFLHEAYSVGNAQLPRDKADDFYRLKEDARYTLALPDSILRDLDHLRRVSNAMDHAHDHEVTSERASGNALMYLGLLTWLYCKWDRGPQLPDLYHRSVPVKPAPQTTFRTGKPTGLAKPETIAAAEAANHPFCCCGCGERVLETWRCFRTGHDAKLKSRLLKVQSGRLAVEGLGIDRAMAQRVLEAGGVTASEFEDILSEIASSV